MADLSEPLALPRSEPSEARASILLVDDNPANVLSLRAILEDLGHDLVEARSGEEALQRVQSDEFAVVLLDVLMPGISGFETAKLMRRQDRSRHTPIIFLTASDIDRPRMEEGYALGAVDFLVKPILPVALRAKVRALVELFQDKQQAKHEADQLRLLVHGTTEYAIFMLDPHGRVVTWNAGAERIKQYKADEIVGRHFSTFYPQDALDRGWPEHELKVAVAEGRFEDEGWRVRKDGTPFWANVVITALRDDQGRLRGFSKVTRDLTARKRTEESLRQSEERFRLLVETATDYAIFMLDPHGHVASWNSGAERIKGYAADEIIGRHFSTFYPQEALDRGWPAHELTVATAEGRFEDEGWRVRKDGSTFWANVVITALKDERGNLLGFSKITRDLTARKQVEENARRLAEEAAARQAAHDERERLRVTLASIGDAVISTDAQGRIDFLNPVAQELVGWGTGEAAGRTLEDVFRIINEDTRQPVENPAQRALKEGVVVGLANHTVLIARDGKERPIDDSAAPIRNERGDVFGSVLVFRDVSERRRAERELREQTGNAETLLRVGSLLAQEHDLHRLVQVVTDEGTRLCGARFGAFFYNVVGERGEAYTLYTLSGVPREAFARFPMPRNTALFGPTFRGEGVVRLADVTQDPRYGQSAPYHGMPDGHLPVRSYLAVPVVFRTGEVLGGLFFGHAEAGVFTERHERLLTGIAGQAAVAIDNARLYQRAQASAERLNLALTAADLGDWSWDAASDVVTFSDRAADVFGIPPGPHMTWTEIQGLIHEDDRGRARREVERVVAERAQYDIEYRVHRRDGSRVWVGVMGRAVYDADRLTGMFGVVRDITDRKRLEESLRHSEGRFRGLMEQAPFSVQVFSADGRTVRVNRAWEELWGITLDQIADYNVLEDRQLEAKGVLPFLQRAFAGEPAFVPAIQYDPNETIPDRTRHADPVRWVAAVAYPLKDDAGVVREVVLVHEDITARRRAEAALRESEQRFRQLADAMPQIVWTAGPDGNIDYLNRRWTEFTGLPETVGNEGWGAILHPEEARPAGKRWAASVRSGAPFDMELRLLDRASQSYRWHLVRTVAVKDEAGAFVRWYGTATDIHGQKRAEESSRYLAEASAALAGVVDYESTLQKVANLAVPRFADWSAVDVADDGGALRRLAVAHQDAQRVRLAHELMRDYPPDPDSPTGAFAVLRTGQPEMVREITDDMLVREVRDERHLGLIRSLGLKSYLRVPLVVSGNPIGVLTFATAESGRTYTEADLALATDLAHRAAVAVENTQLYQALREADRRKDEFLATLAHELRNPLAPIRNALQILKMPRVDAATVRRSRDMMERQVEHLVRLVDDLLDVSRVMRGKIELRKERVELAAVVARAVETVQPLMDAQGHQLSVRITADSLPVDADPVRLAQVVGNLLTNAAKYTEPHGRIWLTAEREGGTAVLRVRDTGMGIAPPMLPRIFELFVQADHASTKAQGGLGIGLTLVKNLVEMHNGTVEARSEGLGKGSEFVVKFPLVAQGITTDQGGETSQQMIPPPASSGHRLLVVDDNQDAADSLAMLLKLQGHEVRVAFSGMAALEMTKAYTPDVVFLDIGMPGMDGYEVARRLRQQPGLERVILAALTGWGQKEDRRRTTEAGFDHHLVKPPDPKAVAGVLAELKPAAR